MHEYTGAQKGILTRAALVNHIMVSVKLKHILRSTCKWFTIPNHSEMPVSVSSSSGKTIISAGRLAGAVTVQDKTKKYWQRHSQEEQTF